LSASDAITSGLGPKGSRPRIQVLKEAEVQEVRPAETCLAITSIHHRAKWRIRSDRQLVAEIALEVACDELMAGSSFLLRLGDQTLRGVVPVTPPRTFVRLH